MQFWSTLYALKCWDETEWKRGYNGSFLNRGKTVSNSATELCYSSALPTWFWIGFSLVFRVWRGQRGRLLVCRRGSKFLATRSVQFMTIFKLNDCEDVCFCVTLIMCVFVDLFNLTDTHRHTQGRVLEVTSWITSFRLCCIITSSAVINSDVPTGMRRCVLHCSPHFLLTHTHTHTGQCLQSDPSCVMSFFKEQ